MKIGKKFNKISYNEYYYYIDRHKKYSDFNTLGLFRSIIENKKLNMEQAIELRNYVNNVFRKSFNFLQLKDPLTYYELITLGQEITQGDQEKIWNDIKEYQKKLLSQKRINHRNFGIHSKHLCGYDHCPYNGIMIKQGSFLVENGMQFKSDKNKYSVRQKSNRIRKERKSGRVILKYLDNE